ncbi:hypothetical protein Tco_0265156 [Tanacetum coccineum]
MTKGEIDNLTVEQYLALTRGNQAPGVAKPEIRGNVNLEIKSQFMRELREDTFFENKNEDIHEHVEYCPPSRTAKQLKEIHKFKQEGDKTLYQAWERYNNLLYKFPTHDVNNHQKINIFDKGLGALNRQLLNLQGPIPGMTHVQALTVIQTMADHS